jgi:YYY domain-containing protein
VFFDWFAREGLMVVSWWTLALLAGAAALPLCWRLLSALPDRGFTFAPAAGLLLTAFTFWLLASLGFLRNEPGSIILSWLIVLAVSLLVFFRVRDDTPFELRVWWRENRAAIITAVLLFSLVLLGWAFVRAHQNGLSGTEKPMDLAFMSAIVRSNTFPPNDPWLSGYSISYYYFGYVIGAMFTKLSGVPNTVGYNLWTAMLFALAAVTTFGVVYNLVRSRGALRRAAVGYAMIGVMILTVMGNLEFALVEMPYQTRTASAPYLDFWDVRNREVPRAENADTTPDGWDFWWWFRAARVIKDRTLPGQAGEGYTEAINEFPMFSYLLADNHPHVMSLPFTLLAMGLGLNVLLRSRRPNLPEILFYGLVVGGLVFLNTWDSPIYIMVLVGAELLRRIREKTYLQRDDWVELFLFGAALLVVTLVAYSPFILSFRSQLGGILPNVTQPTRFRQYFLTFGALVPLVAMFLLLEAWRGNRQRRMSWRFGLLMAGGTLLALVIAMLGLIVIGASVPVLRQKVVEFIEGSGGWNVFMPTVMQYRFDGLLTTVFLFLCLVIIVARLFPHPRKHHDEALSVGYPPATGYALLLAGAGVMLTLIPEYVYLRDNFGDRMNTIFKLYYQAWALFAIASAYGIYTLFSDHEQARPAVPLRALAGAATTVLIGAGLLYPIFGIQERALFEDRNVTGADLTLDGWNTLVQPDDYNVLMCLTQIIGDDDVVMLEATGGSYDIAGRASAFTGIPTVIGWQPHQGQWRGSSYSATVGARPDEVRRIYEDLRLDMVQPMIQKYEIDYILYGSVERRDDRYGPAGEQKFLESYEVVCESGNSRIFRVDNSVLASSGGS